MATRAASFFSRTWSLTRGISTASLIRMANPTVAFFPLALAARQTVFARKRGLPHVAPHSFVKQNAHVRRRRSPSTRPHSTSPRKRGHKKQHGKHFCSPCCFFRPCERLSVVFSCPTYAALAQTILFCLGFPLLRVFSDHAFHRGKICAGAPPRSRRPAPEHP